MENKKETLTAAEEQKRQQQFIEKARIYVREKSEELGRPLYACTTTFGCQMNARDSEKLSGILEQVGYTLSDSEEADFVIYNIPQLAGVALTPSLYKEMLKNPRVIGVKNSSMPVQDIQTFASLGGDDHIVFNGPDEQFLGGRLMGAHAGIGGTYGAMPELFLKLNQLIAEKDLETARALQFAINGIIGVLTSAHGNMYAVIKAVLRINEGLDLGSVRSPLTPVVEADQEVIQRAAQLIQDTKARFL